MTDSLKFCEDLFNYNRRKTREVMVGDVGVGGNNPIRVQSMTIADTMNTEATVDEVIELAEAGCEIVRITAPSIKEAENLGNIKAELRKRGVVVPLVADIHYTPNAALIAADHVEKVRINPGNYADKKKFEQREYTDEEYELELKRIEERFKPLALKCKKLGRAMRIGTNHGSLSDRIMNRHGDTPEGMVESAFEFVRICRKYDYHDIVLSMKSSNPQVAIQAYRLLAARMEELGWDYPFHLGVTEAGDGEQGRVKSAVGIGSLLEDGIGDTVRVSLTEDSVKEVPVAVQLVKKYNGLHAQQQQKQLHITTNGKPLIFFHPFEYGRRETLDCNLLYHKIGGSQEPRVELSLHAPLADIESAVAETAQILGKPLGTDPLTVIGTPNGQNDYKCEAIHVTAQEAPQLGQFREALLQYRLYVPLAVDVTSVTANVPAFARHAERLLFTPNPENETDIAEVISAARLFGRSIEWKLAADDIDESVESVLKYCEQEDFWNILFSLTPVVGMSIVPSYRYLAALIDGARANLPILLRFQANDDFETTILEAASQIGSLLCDGIGDAIHIESTLPAVDVLRLSYGILQATRTRISRTDYISCPSCGRTLFNLQTTTERIKSKTNHLKGVKIAIMGCIVNGPGEMADADFGYVGAGPKKVNLFVGKECVERNIPEDVADERLIELIKRHGQWVEPRS